MVSMRGSYGRRVMSTPTNVSIATIYSDRDAKLHMKNVLRVSEVKVFAKNPHKMTEHSEAWQRQNVWVSGKDFDIRRP